MKSTVRETRFYETCQSFIKPVLRRDLCVRQHAKCCRRPSATLPFCESSAPCACTVLPTYFDSLPSPTCKEQGYDEETRQLFQLTKIITQKKICHCYLRQHLFQQKKQAIDCFFAEISYILKNRSHVLESLQLSRHSELLSFLFLMDSLFSYQPLRIALTFKSDSVSFPILSF